MKGKVPTLSLEEMRQKRNISEALFKKFTEARDLFSTHAFCFFEGEDGKYYNPRISKFWKDNFIPLVAGNKKEVLKVMKKIQTDRIYDSVCVMFFVDRDYDESLTNTNPDLFETPCYSIENLYTQEAVMEQILKAEFGLNIIDTDYHKCMDMYRSRLKEFIHIILKFNAIVRYQHQYAPDIVCQFSAVRTLNLAHITIEQVAKSNRHDEEIDKLKTQLNADNQILEEIEKELHLESQPLLVLRGKNLLDFFVEIIRLLSEANRSGNYFSEKLNNVHIHITKNRLSELSQYAITPPELDLFLAKHRPLASA